MKTWLYEIMYGNISKALMPLILFTIAAAILLIVLDMMVKSEKKT